MNKVKFAVAAAVIAVSGSAAVAGGLDPVVADAPVIEIAPVADTGSMGSLGGAAIPLILVALLAAAASSGGS